RCRNDTDHGIKRVASAALSGRRPHSDGIYISGDSRDLDASPIIDLNHCVNNGVIIEVKDRNSSHDKFSFYGGNTSAGHDANWASCCLQKVNDLIEVGKRGGLEIRISGERHHAKKRGDYLKARKDFYLKGIRKRDHRLRH